MIGRVSELLGEAIADFAVQVFLLGEESVFLFGSGRLVKFTEIITKHVAQEALFLRLAKHAAVRAASYLDRMLLVTQARFLYKLTKLLFLVAFSADDLFTCL